MSSFANYDQVSGHYDDTRIPVGSEIILGCLASRGQLLSGLRLLDAGCGTGAYSAAVIDHVGSLSALDMSAGMLAAAATKLSGQVSSGKAELRHGSILELPYPDGQFDAVMINQVVQHLGDETAEGFPALRQVITGVARVLRQGGSFLFNHCSQAQITQGYWYYDLLPVAAETTRRRFAPFDVVEQLLAEAGFRIAGRFVPVDSTTQGDDYFRADGPLDRAWRDGDSIWEEATAVELEDALRRVREMAAAGRLEAYRDTQDARRPDVGQITILHAIREEI